MDVSRQIDDLARRGFLVVTGKGGVGKSTVTALLGRFLSRGGWAGDGDGARRDPASATNRRVLVIEVDPRENLHRLLHAPPSGGEIVDVGGGLSLQHLKPRAVVDRVIEEKVRIGAVTRKVFASPVYQHFVEGAPGLEELAILEHARRLLDEGRFETVILDAPATGHGVSMLRAPLVVSGVVRGGPFGGIAERIGELVEDPSRCGVVVVTAGEEMPVQEALELARTLREELRRDPDLLVVNGLYPPLPGEGGAAAGSPAELEGAPSDLVDLWRERREMNVRELERLRTAWGAAESGGEGPPRVELPLLPIAPGPELVAALGKVLDRTLNRRRAAGAGGAP